MRHKNHKYKLSVTRSHRKSIVMNLAKGIIDNGGIVSTTAKCRAVRPFIEKLITIAKNDSVQSRRLAYTKLNDKVVVAKLFTDIAPKYKERPGGYTRTVRLADQRHGDGAELSSISLV